MVTVSKTFGADADLKNLAIDPSGLYAVFHTENGFFNCLSDSLDRCLILSAPNDCTYDDRG